MKHLMTLLLIGFSFLAMAQEEEIPMTGPKIAFTEKSFDFGEIMQGDRVEHIFEFENKGTEPLILSDIRTTCGCTVSEWPREPIAPGKKSNIKVRFNSTGKKGLQNKIVTVMSNAVNNPERVKIVTNVLTPE